MTIEIDEAKAQSIALLEQNLHDRMMRGLSVSDAFEAMRRDEKIQFGGFPDALNMRLEALDAAFEHVSRQLDAVSYWRRSAIKSGRPDWYGGPSDDAKIWGGLAARLKALGRTDDEITVVNHESTAVVSLLDNPGLNCFSTRGLVIGHVQSGKTGNMAAVMAKAADTPYKFFLVLSGMTDSLRNQTQARLDADLVDSGNAQRWFRWTHVDRVVDGQVVEKRDFSHPSGGGFLLDGATNHLAVMKKNAGVLRRFLRKLKSTPRAVLESTPFLIIDDECDQASVNSAALRTAISTINELIREIIETLPRVAYVGYTATPFANVLINPADSEDLYPRHFIHPLERSPAYFGAEELFGRNALEGDDTGDESGYDVIRIVPDCEAAQLRPGSRKSGTFQFQVTPSLARSIEYFLLAIAAREVRGQSSEHSTMLIHTSMLNSVHKSARNAVQPFLEKAAKRLQSGDEEFLLGLRTLWNDEVVRCGADEFGLQSIDFDQLVPRLAEIARSVEVKVENWTSDERIDYSVPARRYLVIGGNVLARGLTLNGLVVSFFMRSTSQYDTLMQMGRWFGYRKGFEDLPRIWMETTVRNAFFDLATVEEEIRRDAATYAEENLTPEQFAVRIRKIPGLAITARAKMRDARTAQIGYQGEHLQTIKFPRYDENWLKANWGAAHRLLLEDGDLRQVGPNRIKLGVKVDSIKRFFEAYNTEESHASMRRELLLSYIEKVMNSDSSLVSWNVALIGSFSGAFSKESLGGIKNVTCVNRSPLKDSGDIAFIKALMSRSDLLVDFDVRPADASRMGWDEIKAYREKYRMPPLLLLYPINRNSIPASLKAPNVREPMGAVMDLMGLGVVFPGLPGTGLEYVQADIQPEDAEEVFAGEDAIPEDVIDAAR